MNLKKTERGFWYGCHVVLELLPDPWPVFPGDLSYCLHLLISFDAVEVDHGGRLTAMGSVLALVVVEGDPAPDADPSLRSSFPSVQIDAFILQGPPEAFDEDVVETAPFAVHRDPGADPFQPVGPDEGRELAALDALQRVKPRFGFG